MPPLHAPGFFPFPLLSHLCVALLHAHGYASCERFCLWLMADHGEPLHVLHYELGQEYQAHYDYFHDSVNTRNGGQRIATMLMYL